MSALPKQVQRAVDQANEIAKQLNAGKNPPAADPNAPAPAADPNAPAPAPAAAAPAAAPAAPAPAPAAAAPPPPAPPASAGPLGVPVDWEHRYRVLQGKFNAEVPRLSNEIRDLRQQLATTQGLLASLSARPAAPAAPAAPPAPLVSEKEVKEFGPDLIDVMRRVARQEQQSLLPEIDRRVAPVVQKVDAAQAAANTATQLTAQQQRAAMFDLLNRQVPNWKQLNEDEGFLAWLDQLDPYTNTKRDTLLQQAEAANDGPRVVAFFLGYQRENALVAPPPAAPAAAAPAPAPAAPAAASQPTLQDMVAPGTSRPAAPRAPDGSGKRVWTRAEISRFYADRSAGRYNSEAGKKRAVEIEADIFAASKEGRISN